MFFNTSFEGLHRIRTDEPFPVWCNAAKVVSDALLFTLGYSDSAAPREARYDPPEFTTTILVLLRKPRQIKDPSRG
jgi:hypothetical protein